MAFKLQKPPDAFLSYTRFDDQHDGGAISEFCRRLASAVRAVTGAPFEIFQDVEGIGIGEHWPGKLDEMLNEARFFIPVVTPSYFTSQPCREELAKFLRAEAARGRNDLILPIYYIESEVLEDNELRGEDSLARTLHERQRQDWRELRFESFGAGDVRRALERLAREIVLARRRPMRPPEEKAHERAVEEARKVEEEDRKQTAAGEAELVARKQAEQEAGRRATDEARRWVAEARQHSEAAQVIHGAEEEEARKPAATEAHGRPRQTVARSASMEPGTVFRDVDAPWCPEMVVIPPGEVLTGANEAERLRAVEVGGPREWLHWETPRGWVRISYPLAVGRYPVTFEEYGHFARTTGRAQPSDEGWGRGRRPVINVDWEDAKAFATWLSAETGERYRLLSEAEWEYACRAGTTTKYWWGDGITPKHANYKGKIRKTTEVGSYPANRFGLYDTHGNVWEWVEDCWHNSYEGAPADGSAWTERDNDERVVRGGSWKFQAEELRAARRFKKERGIRYNDVGFRVARTLAAQPEENLVKDMRRSKLRYHDPELAGRVTFNYSNNDGKYSIGQNEFFFETQWSKADDQSIYLYNDPPSIVGIAEAPGLRSYMDVTDLANYDMSSRVRLIQEGEHAILKNFHSKCAVLKVLDIKDRTRADTLDELTFDFWVLNDTEDQI